MKVLVIGGAGYIGSHMVKMLVEHGHTTTVYDNLISGYRDAVPPTAEFILGDLSDPVALQRIVARNFDGIMHFASFIQVGESVKQPGKYKHQCQIEPQWCEHKTKTRLYRMY